MMQVTHDNLTANSLFKGPNYGTETQPTLTQHMVHQRADSTVYVADLPLTVHHSDLVECFERKIGPCEILIKRCLFKNFHFAFVQFRDPFLGKTLAC